MKGYFNVHVVAGFKVIILGDCMSRIFCLPFLGILAAGPTALTKDQTQLHPANVGTDFDNFQDRQSIDDTHQKPLLCCRHVYTLDSGCLNVPNSSS
jgi:hypothetical protein